MRKRNHQRLLSSTLAVLLASAVSIGQIRSTTQSAEPAYAATSTGMSWGTLGISGGGFVSGIITGQSVMYARTDVGGAYKYNYETSRWDQLMSFISEKDRGYLSVDAIAIDPSNDDNVYMLCGCAYFSDARTAVFISHDGGKSFTEHDVTDLIQVHGNGYGRQCGESIAVDPANPKTIYVGGDTVGLIVSNNGGVTWESVASYDALGLFTEDVKWPTWTDHIVKTTGTEYGNSNGISTIAITGGKVYVGASVIGQTNLYVADVGKDNWKPMSADLPTQWYPSRLNLDADGNLLVSYVPTLVFGNGGGGAYRYDVKSGAVTDISPKKETPFGAVFSAPKDANTLIATTCGMWVSQLWDKDDWETDRVSWGDILFRSTDGGVTWEQLSPGNAKYWEGPLQADYLQDGGSAWVDHKAIHWSGAVVLDPCDIDRMLVTSGNGVFACDNIWDELPQIYFHADGIEEVVSLDLVSVPGGAVYSAIGDYDGFIHTSVTESTQYQPNMGSTSGIAYCPSNPKIMCRYSEGKGEAYYSKDAGATWTKMAGSATGKAAITQLKDGTYRFFKSSGNSIAYSDDYGATWKEGSGKGGASIVVDPEKPNYIYSAGNDNNGYDPTCKPNNYLYVSADYGSTWTTKTICAYDRADDYSRIAAVGNGTVYCCAGYGGLYRTTDYGETFEKIDSLAFVFAVGFGAGKTASAPAALYTWACETDGGPYGIFRSDDEGATWVRINDDEHSFGGTGNGKYIVGDRNTYGTVYMSTVGMGIVYGQLDDGAVIVDPTLWGDANCDKSVDIGDVVLLNRYIAEDKDVNLTAKGLRQADVDGDSSLSSADATKIMKYLAKLITAAQLAP